MFMSNIIFDQLKTALENVANIDPTVDSEEDNEWAEADCFTKAQEIARAALEKIKQKDLDDPSIVSLKEALEKICLLDPEIDSKEDNEWVEADCFWKVHAIANQEINDLDKEFNSLKI